MSESIQHNSDPTHSSLWEISRNKFIGTLSFSELGNILSDHLKNIEYPGKNIYVQASQYSDLLKTLETSKELRYLYLLREDRDEMVDKLFIYRHAIAPLPLDKNEAKRCVNIVQKFVLTLIQDCLETSKTEL